MIYTKTCWSCGKDAMRDKGDYSQCSECGATWNELPVAHFEGLVIEKVDEGGRDTKYRPYKKRSGVR